MYISDKFDPVLDALELMKKVDEATHSLNVLIIQNSIKMPKAGLWVCLQQLL